jgi:hypothetical protein
MLDCAARSPHLTVRRRLLTTVGDDIHTARLVSATAMPRREEFDCLSVARSIFNNTTKAAPTSGS